MLTDAVRQGLVSPRIRRDRSPWRVSLDAHSGAGRWGNGHLHFKVTWRASVPFQKRHKHLRQSYGGNLGSDLSHPGLLGSGGCVGARDRGLQTRAATSVVEEVPWGQPAPLTRALSGAVLCRSPKGPRSQAARGLTKTECFLSGSPRLSHAFWGPQPGGGDETRQARGVNGAPLGLEWGGSRSEGKHQRSQAGRATTPQCLLPFAGSILRPAKTGTEKQSL